MDRLDKGSCFSSVGCCDRHLDAERRAQARGPQTLVSKLGSQSASNQAVLSPTYEDRSITCCAGDGNRDDMCMLQCWDSRHLQMYVFMYIGDSPISYKRSWSAPALQGATFGTHRERTRGVTADIIREESSCPGDVQLMTLATNPQPRLRRR